MVKTFKVFSFDPTTANSFRACSIGIWASDLPLGEEKGIFNFLGYPLQGEFLQFLYQGQPQYCKTLLPIAYLRGNFLINAFIVASKGTVGLLPDAMQFPSPAQRISESATSTILIVIEAEDSDSIPPLGPCLVGVILVLVVSL